MDLTLLDKGLAGVAASSAVAALVFWVAYKKTRKRADSAEGELEKLRGAEQRQEYRLDRYELIWWPAVTFDPKKKMVLRAAPGVPHCKDCIEALVSKGGAWKCPKCGTQRPDSVVDTTVTDSVAKEAVRWFLQRYPGYQLAPELQRFK